MNLRTCLKCGRVAFGVTRSYAEIEAAGFNEYFDTLNEDGRDQFGNRRSSVGDYERCLRCGGPHTNFRDAVEGDCPAGCTLSPIIVEVS